MENPLFLSACLQFVHIINNLFILTWVNTCSNCIYNLLFLENKTCIQLYTNFLGYSGMMNISTLTMSLEIQICENRYFTISAPFGVTM